MSVHNSDLAEIFSRIADLLELKGENPFRIRAYRNASRTVGGLSKSVADLVKKEKDLSHLPGIGKDLAGKIKKIVETGSHPLLAELEKELPSELPDLMKIQGMGPKKTKELFEKLGIKSIEELKKAAAEKKIQSLDGFGEKTEQNILDELDRIKTKKGEKERIKISVAEQIAQPLVKYLKKTAGVKDIEVAGSYRRQKETVGDLDILATCRKGSKVMERFINYDEVAKILSRGKTKSSVVLRSGLQVDLRVAPQVSFGSALHYFTGSKEHNIAVRKMGVKKNLKINEYGVFRGEKRIAGRTEKEVYKQVGLPCIEPELRENRGELEAAKKRNLPELIVLDDIKGDLHVHTKSTDGHYSLEEMAEAAKKRGYDYIAITDHSQHVKVAKGLNAERLWKQIEQIDQWNKKRGVIRILKSIELDILEDGSLDLPDEVLKKLDLVVCAIHYKFNLSREKQTERIIRAMDHPCFNIFSHPTGRLINERKPYEINMEEVMKAAKEKGCYLELNSHPDRLDLNDIDCKMAKDMGVKIAIATDAHSVDDLDLMGFGIGQARRGWLEAEDVLNTRSWKELKKLLKRE
ncbi:MAG: DNA polymerase/3'-5' exonuclease PolX [Candidatus Aminicenantes bacterium]|jgi:DNA polymerase (family 10)